MKLVCLEVRFYVLAKDKNEMIDAIETFHGRCVTLAYRGMVSMVPGRPNEQTHAKSFFDEVLSEEEREEAASDD